MNKTSSNTTTSRKCDLKVRTAIKVGVMNNPLYEADGASGTNPLFKG